MTMSEEIYKSYMTKKAIYARIRKMANDQEWKPSKSRKTGLWSFENMACDPRNQSRLMTDSQALQWLLDGMKNPSTVDMVICGEGYRDDRI